MKRNGSPTLLTAGGCGGALPFFNDAVGGTVVNVKSAVGQLYYLKLVNTTAGVAYLQVFNLKASDVTLGTTVARWTLRLAANEVMNLPMATPLDLSVATGATGISVAGTTTATGSSGAAISVSALYA